MHFYDRSINLGLDVSEILFPYHALISLPQVSAPPLSIMSDSTRLKDAQALAAKVSRLKNLPWFYSEIGPSLTPAGRELLEVYSHIEPSKVEEHIYKIVGSLIHSTYNLSLD